MKYYLRLAFILCNLFASSVAFAEGNHAKQDTSNENHSTKDSFRVKEEKSKNSDLNMEADKAKKVNYFWPIVGGAVLGIGLALWLKRKK